VLLILFYDIHGRKGQVLLLHGCKLYSRRPSSIPRGTLIIMSTQDSSLKESNFDDAALFKPDRWLQADSKDYHAFASVPFGYGARKCLGQNVAETMMTILTIRVSKTPC
jgi:cytochrome P450